MDFGIVQFTSDRGLAPATLAPLVENAGFDAYFVRSTVTSPPSGMPPTHRPATRRCPTTATCAPSTRGCRSVGRRR